MSPIVRRRCRADQLFAGDVLDDGARVTRRVTRGDRCTLTLDDGVVFETARGTRCFAQQRVHSREELRQADVEFVENLALFLVGVLAAWGVGAWLRGRLDARR